MKVFAFSKDHLLWILIKEEWTGGWVILEVGGHSRSHMDISPFTGSLSPALLDCLRATPSLRQSSFVLFLKSWCESRHQSDNLPLYLHQRFFKKYFQTMACMLPVNFLQKFSTSSLTHWAFMAVSSEQRILPQKQV